MPISAQRQPTPSTYRMQPTALRITSASVARIRSGSSRLPAAKSGRLAQVRRLTPKPGPAKRAYYSRGGPQPKVRNPAAPQPNAGIIGLAVPLVAADPPAPLNPEQLLIATANDRTAAGPGIFNLYPSVCLTKRFNLLITLQKPMQPFIPIRLAAPSINHWR